MHLCVVQTPHQHPSQYSASAAQGSRLEAGAQSMLVAVKMLRSNADAHARECFKKEARIMAKLRHENIVQVLGVSGGDSLRVVVEYMKHGDLHALLQQSCEDKIR